MPKFTNLLFLLFMLCVLSSASCEKESEEPDGPEKLIVGTWQRTGLEYGNNGTWRDGTTACMLDDTEEFIADGKWKFSGGALNCGSGTGTLNGTYSFVPEENKFIMRYSHTPTESEKTINSISSQEMILTHAIGDVNNTLARTTYLKK